MPAQAPEFHKGARVRVKSYGKQGFSDTHESKYNGLEGVVGAVYGGKFYRVVLDCDPDGSTWSADGLQGLLAYAHEMELVDED